MSFWQDRSTS
ncbi:hypothetical protein F383_30554 [Gossypium arboreum]|uniref:Uncharacterized protein n=1 Tax=Gossypium arboreum TaxID=29729 RepID=A0A0B0MWT7_GOSAR|nr:hypothetical protein F383_30554 [Gossypium arboreum]